MKSLYLGSLLLLIVGCSQTPQYVLPANAPQAQIRSELDTMSNRRNGMSLTDAPTMACKYGRSVTVKPGRELFSISGDTTRPEGFRGIEAAKPIHLVLLGWASGNRSCRVDFVSEFTPGARYVLKGGIIDGPNNVSTCQVRIFDQDSGVRLPMSSQELPKADGCALDQWLPPVL
ncbi:hypothetical protein HX882_33445 [Pseudomonas gingeri]|uniref:Lipoprotein n=1 Tax=Pseudomonas gingeri TaxID=117681 RepID=A0A7Y7XJJ1_9PSED|nr:hypothetical protein [Pseudomonas gingeri]NWC00782.1 hypothetical protein [Pseudomonas gingeri]